MKNLKLPLITLLLFSFVNLITFLLIYSYDLGFREIVMRRVILLPLIFSIFLYLTVRFIHENVFIFPALIVVVKLGIFLFGADKRGASDFLMDTSTNFSLPFNIMQYYLERNGLNSNPNEILLHVIGIFLYQCLGLLLAKKIAFNIRITD
jgi:hypothetical protein